MEMWKTLFVVMRDLLRLHNHFPPKKVLCVFSGTQLLYSTEKEEFKSSRPRLHSGMLPQCEPALLPALEALLTARTQKGLGWGSDGQQWELPVVCRAQRWG